MEKEMAPKYDHLQVESGKYQNWIDQGYFTAGDVSKRPYCIVIPPPNVTGKLHLGPGIQHCRILFVVINVYRAMMCCG